MEVIVNRERTVSIIVLRKQLPAVAILATSPKIKTGLLYVMILLVAGIDGPANSIEFKYERSCVHITMTDGSFSSLPSEVVLTRVICTTAEDDNRVLSISFPDQWQIRC